LEEVEVMPVEEHEAAMACAMRFGPRTYTPEQAEVIADAVANRKPLSTQLLPLDGSPPQPNPIGDREQALVDIAEAFETRPLNEAMRCSEVALYCREQAALASFNQKGGEQ
jgi:hypothetical protein